MSEGDQPSLRGRAARVFLLACLLAACDTVRGMDPPALGKVRALIEEGRYGEAEKESRALLADVGARTGPGSLATANVMDVLVESLYLGGKVRNSDARDLARRALDIKESLLGDGNPDSAASLINLGNISRHEGDVSTARSFFQRALALRERSLPPDHLDIADALSHMGALLLESGDSSDAEPLYRRALAIRRKALGCDHRDVGWTLSNLARIQRNRGEYSSARQLFEQALSIVERTVSPDHPGLASLLNGLAVLYDDTGDYAAARAPYEKALRIWRSTLGSDHPRTASTLNNLALLHRNMGDYPTARSLYEETLATKGKIFPPKHPQIATTLANLAELYSQMGDYREARKAYDRALESRVSAYGSDSSAVASTLDHMGALLEQTGDLDEALILYRRALALWRKTPDSDHRAIPRLLNRIAKVTWTLGDPVAARALCHEALALQRKLQGPDALDVAETEQTLAGLLRDAGEHAEAHALYRHALDVRGMVLGREHPQYSALLSDYARSLMSAGNTELALDTSLQAEQIARDHLRLIARHLSERLALRYASVRASSLDLSLSIAAGNPLSGAVERAWDSLIRSRALVLDEVGRRQRTVAGAREPRLAGSSERLRAARTRLANLTVRGLLEEDSGRYQSLVDEARREAEQIENELAEASLPLQRESSDQTGLPELRGSLPEGCALLAYARYNRYATGPSAAGRASGAIPSYVALLLRADTKRPLLIPLGESRHIDGLVGRWVEQARTYPPAPAGERPCRAAGEALRSAIWDPIKPHVEGMSSVFVVQDGALHLVNLAALPYGEASYLVESGPVIHHLSAERDLVHSRRHVAPGKGFLVLAAPSFDADPTGFFRFEELPATAQEARAIIEILRARRKDAAQPYPAGIIELTGKDASERRFKKEAPGRRSLHLATHGFFLGDGQPASLPSARGFGGVSTAGKLTASSGVDQNPLLLSGLALAGANRRLPPDGEEDDGILTAEEVAGLNLSGVEWVVLSACDTGAGVIAASEGVLGLRRAFQISGAATLIMSLWPIQDEAARRWMTALYDARYSAGLRTAEAMRAATLRILDERRGRGETTHPFFWGGFVAAGDWN